MKLKMMVATIITALFISGCAQKVKIKAIKPAEVEEMATKKKVAISSFRNDYYGLSGKIESQIARHKLDSKRYFTVLSRKDLDKIMAEQRLQSSELMDETTATRVGKIIGAQAVINGEIASANGESRVYYKDAKECLLYDDKKNCKRWRFYKIVCNTTHAEVSANINVINVETASIIYGDSITREYSADSCNPSGGLLSLGNSNKVLSKTQALNRLTTAIADEFVRKLTPHYVYFEVELLDKIELKSATSVQEKIFENALKYIEANRMKRAEVMLEELLDELDGRSYVVAFVYGVVLEAEGKLSDAKKAYMLADSLTIEPVDEINLALKRIELSIENSKIAQRQMNAK